MLSRAQFSGLLIITKIPALIFSLGDKPYQPYVSSEPELSSLSLKAYPGETLLLVIACDGVWDVLSNEVLSFSYFLASVPSDVATTHRHMLLFTPLSVIPTMNLNNILILLTYSFL